MTTDDVATYLSAHGLTTAVSSDGHIPTQPDQLVVLTLTGGPGERRERTFDVLALQVLARGAQRSPADAERLAQQVDDIMLAVKTPGATFGSTHVASVLRAGGPPAFVAREPGSGRVTYGCSYLLEAARSAF